MAVIQQRGEKKMNDNYDNRWKNIASKVLQVTALVVAIASLIRTFL